MSIHFAYALTLLTQTGSRATRVLLTLYALNLGAEPVAIGGLAAAFSVLPVMLSWPMGRLSDYYGPRWLLAFGIVGGIVGMLMPYFWPGLVAIYVAAALNGVSVGFVNVTMQNVIGTLSTQETRAKNFSNFSMMNSTASFIGPLFAGISIQYAGHGASCLYVIGLYVVSVGILAAGSRALPKGGRGKSSPAGGMLSQLSDPNVLKVLAVSSLVQTGQDMFQFYIPVYAHGIGISAATIGVILAMFAASGFVVRLVTPRLLAKHGEGAVLAYSFYLSAACFLLVPFVENVWVLGLLSFAFGLGNGCGQPITMLMTFSNSAEGRSGEALGLRSSVNHLTRAVGPLLFGYVASITGLAAVFWINALMLGGGAVLSNRKKSGRDA
ncbi:MAG: MFS transporter [Betaproteobacteria bacterium]|nr:MFS transporter [Betaproteobacteria bacterium]